MVTIPGRASFEGKNLANLLPFRDSDRYRTEHMTRCLRTYLQEGHAIYIEIVKGARKGTIGRLKITADDCDDLYREIRTGRGQEWELTKRNWEIAFDDRPNVIKVEHGSYQSCWPGIAHFEVGTFPTVWIFATTAKEKKPAKVLYDHFGTELAVGQLVMVPMGGKGMIATRFGYIKSISEAGTIKVETIKTRTGHKKSEENVGKTIVASDLVILDNNDVKDKVTLAKLTHA